MSDTALRCGRLSRNVEILLLLLGCAVLLLLGLVAVSPQRMLRADALPLYLSLALVWLAWAALMLANARLVSCGRRSIRYGHAPRFVNRPELAIRLFLHFTINWSAVFVTVVVAWFYREQPFAEYLAGGVIVVAVGVALAFNVLHRRMNRTRNVLLGSAVAGAVILACVRLLA